MTEPRGRGRAWKPDATGARCLRCARTFGGHAGRHRHRCDRLARARVTQLGVLRETAIACQRDHLRVLLEIGGGVDAAGNSQRRARERRQRTRQLQAPERSDNVR